MAQKRYRIIVKNVLLESKPIYIDTLERAQHAAEQWFDFFFVPHTVIIEALFSNGWYEIGRLEGYYE